MSEVMMLIGKLPFVKICEIHEKISIEKIPSSTTSVYNLPTDVCLKAIRQICGIARPMNAIGPTNAVADAVRIAEETKISHLIFLTLMPML